jgi:hypothetical protein
MEKEMDQCSDNICCNPGFLADQLELDLERKESLAKLVHLVASVGPFPFTLQ